MSKKPQSDGSFVRHRTSLNCEEASGENVANNTGQCDAAGSVDIYHGQCHPVYHTGMSGDRLLWLILYIPRSRLSQPFMHIPPPTADHRFKQTKAGLLKV